MNKENKSKQEQMYTMEPPFAESSPLDKPLIDVPRIMTDINTRMK